MSLTKPDTARQNRQDPLRRRLTGPARRKGAASGDQRRRVGFNEADRSHGLQRDIGPYDDETDACDEFPAICRLLDPGFDAADGFEGMEIGRWLGCPNVSAAGTADEEA